MKYKEYGNTQKKVSVIGFGGLRFTNNEKEGIEAVEKALELGVNYFDTAPNYCNGRSESIIGEGLKGFSGKAYISTKSMVSMDPKSGDVIKRIHTSLKRLKVEKIDFFHIWNIKDWKTFERGIKKGGTYEGALRAKEEGLIEHIAFSSHASGTEIVRMIETGLFEGVTLSYNIINHPYRWNAIQAASKAGIGIATMNSLHGGLIPQAENILSFIKEYPEDSVVQAALRFNIYHPEISVVLTGMRNVKEVEENVKAANTFYSPSSDIALKMKEKFLSSNKSFCTLCGYCLPCKNDINIPLYMDIYNMSSLGMEQMAKHKYAIYRMKNEFGAARTKDCEECGACEEKCTQDLDIMKRLQDVSAFDISNFKVRIMKIVSSSVNFLEKQHPVISGIRRVGRTIKHAINKVFI